MNLAQRIRHAMMLRGLIAADLARACSITPVSISNLLSGESKSMKGVTASKMAAAMGVNVRWLTEGIGPMEALHRTDANELKQAGRVVETSLDDDDKVFVSRVKGARFAAGSGELMFEAEEIDQSHGFRKDYMQRRGLRPERCKLFNVKGESMLPTLQDGGLVLVNMADREVVSGKIYALVTKDGLRVKRLHRRSDGIVEMRSDNPMQNFYPPEDILDGNAAVIGRVVWHAGDL